MKRKKLARRGALWGKAALCGPLEGKPDVKHKNSEEHYLWRKAAIETSNLAQRGTLWRDVVLETTNLALCGAFWRKAALCGALEGRPDFKLKNSVEHYYTHENNKFGAARRFLASRGALQRT